MLSSAFGRGLRLVVSACALSAVLAGCSVTGGTVATASFMPTAPDISSHYAALESEKFPVDEVDTSHVDPLFLKQTVTYRSPYPAGTIVVDPHKRFLYLVQKDGQAIRYGVGVGREGLAFAGTGIVREKREWPHWTPTSAMIAREPERYRKWAKGMEGGIGNPLGARALYLFKDGKDTRYRIHGTTEPDSIGKAVSSGCIRMMNQDVIDLYSRIPLGTKVVVL
ncbi:lipoprotein-anchoring transpeptidase ErfK/SrfK [Bradyrhizobium sp. AZCC 1577]|uniref:L,D-transpeptidase n=1 Tax=Bradyrhizobium sp. AZCC 1577 TaxID=3117019 RepID=UPI002FEFFCDE